MKGINLLILLVLSSIFVLAQPKQKMANYFTNNGFGSAIGGKSGEHYKGITYISYQGPHEDAYVAAYNHSNGKWDGPYKAGTSLLGKTPGRKIDNHGKPSLVIDGQGYIHIVFGGHGGKPEMGANPLGNYHDGKQIHVVSKKPLDISSWEEVPNITPFGTYSEFMKMDNGDIYLFYRHGAHRSNWVYQYSKDNCRTFSEPVSIVQTKKTIGTIENLDVQDSWYLSFANGEGNDILVAFNYHVCKEPNHDGERHNSYYMKFDTDTKEWLNVKGEKLQLPITKEYADQMTLIKNTGDNWTHNGFARLDTQGNPYVSSYEGENTGHRHGGPKQIQLYRWNGIQWLGCNSGLPVGAEGRMEVGGSDTISYLLGFQNNRIGEVTWWHSYNGGQSFTKGEALISEKGSGFLVSQFIRNAHPDARIAASKRIPGTDYMKMYLLGDNGPVMREKSEADVIRNFESK